MAARKKAPKPPQVSIDDVPALSASPHRHPDPMACCNVCGTMTSVAAAPGALKLYRECDGADKPIQGLDALVFLGVDHAACDKVLSDHPRLYLDSRGMPVSFPLLCGPCVFRQGLDCTHKDLKANGGTGLMITMPGKNGLPAGAIICGGRGRGRGCWSPPREATKCAGRRTLRLVAEVE